MSSQNTEKLITDFLLNRLTPTLVYLFGSRATNFVHTESDYDIAYLSKQKLDNYERFMLAQELAAILNHDVDLIDLEEASTVLQVQIIGKGKTLYCTDDTEKTMFEMRTLKKYAMLNEERQEVMKNVLESGQIYKIAIVLDKITSIERCLSRIREEYDNNPLNLENDTKQDSIILNIQRVCEAGIDIAMHVVATKKFGIPQSSRDAFEFLAKNNVITDPLTFRMKAMVGFRNITVHDYQEINLDIVRMIIEKHLNDYKKFTKQILSYDY